MNTGNLASSRLSKLFDDNSFSELFLSSEASIVIGKGVILGKTVYAFLQNPENQNGALTKGSYEKLKALYDLVYKTGDPIIGVYDGFGGKADETEASLRAMSEIYKKISALSGVVPQISLCLGNCVGSMATAAFSADLIIASKGSDLYDSCVAYKAETEDEAIETLRSIIDKLPSNNLSDGDIFEWTDKPLNLQDTKDYMNLLADEFSSTLLYKDCGVLADFCTVKGNPTMLLGFMGDITPKAAAIYSRLIRFADAYSLPIISLVSKAVASEDCPLSFADLYKTFASATTAKISVVLDEIYGSILSGYVLSGSDFTVALSSAVISAAKPSAAAYLLYSDEMEGDSEDEALKKITDKYIKEYATAEKACKSGLISFTVELKDLKAKLADYLDVLSAKKETTLPKKHSI